MPPTRDQRAFTLVELLIVLAVIAVLVVMLLPVLGTVRERTTRTKCLTKLRQLQVGCISYAGEHNGVFPAVPNALSPHYFPSAIYAQTLQPYTGARADALFCAGILRTVRNGTLTSPDYVTQYMTFQYFNFTGPFLGALAGDKKPNLTRTATLPTRIPLWGCLALKAGSGNAFAHEVANQNKPITGMNVVYPDGSAAWVAMSDMELYFNDGSNNFYWPKPPNP